LNLNRNSGVLEAKYSKGAGLNTRLNVLYILVFEMLF